MKQRHTMSDAQQAYAVAKAAADAAWAAYEQELDARGINDIFERDMEAGSALMDEVDAKHGMSAAHAAYRAAESALIEWGRSVTESMPEYARMSTAQQLEIQHMYEVAKWHAQVRAKLVDITFRLAA